MAVTKRATTTTQQPRAARPSAPQGGMPGMTAATAPALVGEPITHPAPDVSPYTSVSPLMQGSLPPAASGSDAYNRQFYNGGPGRIRRFLPVSLVPGRV